MAEAAAKSEGLYDCRDAFAATIEALAAEDPRICAVVNDSVGSSKLGGFQKTFPDRLVNVGIAEQLMVGVGAGLANGGRIPFVSGASCFLTGRALEQIKADVVYSGTNVKLVGQSSGIAYGELGPTHHSIEDFAWLRPMTGLTVLVPADPWQTTEMIRWAAAHDGPVYIRLSRSPVPDLAIPNRVFEPGKAELVTGGGDVALLATGTTVHLAAAAARTLHGEGLSARVLNLSSLNPLDEAAVLAAAGDCGALVTIEEASIRGGFGGAVAELLAMRRPTPIEFLGFPGFQPTGSVEYLFDRAGLTPEGIAAAARRAVQRKGA